MIIDSGCGSMNGFPCSRLLLLGCVCPIPTQVTFPMLSAYNCLRYDFNWLIRDHFLWWRCIGERPTTCACRTAKIWSTSKRRSCRKRSFRNSRNWSNQVTDGTPVAIHRCNAITRSFAFISQAAFSKVLASGHQEHWSRTRRLSDGRPYRDISIILIGWIKNLAVSTIPTTVFGPYQLPIISGEMPTATNCCPSFVTLRKLSVVVFLFPARYISFVGLEYTSYYSMTSSWYLHLAPHPSKAQ